MQHQSTSVDTSGPACFLSYLSTHWSICWNALKWAVRNGSCMTLLVCRTDRFSSTTPAPHRVIQRASPHGTRTDGPSDFPLRYCSSFSPPASVKQQRAEWDGDGDGMRSFVSPELARKTVKFSSCRIPSSSAFSGYITL